MFSNMMLNLTEISKHSSALPTNCSENILGNKRAIDYNPVIAICAVNAPFGLAAFLGNAAVLTALYKTPTLYSPTNILLASLAASDLAVGSVAQPLFMLYHLADVGDSQTFFDVTTIIFSILSYWLCSVSFASVTTVGVDRLLALELHLRYKDVVTCSRTRFLVVSIWIACGLLAGIKQWNDKIFFNVLALLIFVCLFGTFFVHFRIYRILRHHRVQIHAQELSSCVENLVAMERLKKSSLNIFYVYCLFLVCYAPYLCSVISLFIIGERLSVLFNITVTIVYVNSTLNPLLYCWRIRDIRKAVRQTLSRLFCNSSNP